jgi:hypothetical protein
MKCRFELTYLYNILTYLKTIKAKVVMFGIKPKLIKCRFALTYFYDLLTYFYDLLTYFLKDHES